MTPCRHRFSRCDLFKPARAFLLRVTKSRRRSLQGNAEEKEEKSDFWRVRSSAETVQSNGVQPSPVGPVGRPHSRVQPTQSRPACRLDQLKNLAAARVGMVTTAVAMVDVATRVSGAATAKAAPTPLGTALAVTVALLPSQPWEQPCWPCRYLAALFPLLSLGSFVAFTPSSCLLHLPSLSRPTNLRLFSCRLFSMSPFRPILALSVLPTGF